MNRIGLLQLASTDHCKWSTSMTNSSIHLDCRTAPCLLDFGSIFALAPDVRGPQSNFRFPRQTRQINPHGVDEIQKLDRGWQIRTWCGHPPVPGLGALKSENLAEFRNLVVFLKLLVPSTCFHPNHRHQHFHPSFC